MRTIRRAVGDRVRVRIAAIAQTGQLLRLVRRAEFLTVEETVTIRIDIRDVAIAHPRGRFRNVVWGSRRRNSCSRHLLEFSKMYA